MDPRQGLPEIPGFEIVRRCGTGGFSSVYEAIDELGGTVALKVLRNDLADERARSRFERECRAMGRLRGEVGIVSVYRTTYTIDGRPVIVMELCPGGSLAERVKTSGPLSADEAARIGVDLAEALARAHEAGIFHRDIKPENILATGTGAYALADFGIAALEGQQSSTETAATLTPPHAPPERFSGESEQPGLEVAGDVYSLGSTLHMLLTGSPPFGTVRDGGIAALARRVTVDPPAPIHRADVPPVLEASLLRALEKRPADRFPDMQSFADALVAAAEACSRPDAQGAPTMPVQQLAVPVRQRSRRARSRMRALAAVAALVCVALVVAGFYVSTRDSDDTKQATTAGIQAYHFEPEPQGPISARRSWSFTSASGDQVAGEVTGTRVPGKDATGAELREFVPSVLLAKRSAIEWTPEPTHTDPVTIAAGGGGKSASRAISGEVVRFTLPSGESRVKVTYRLAPGRGPTSERRLLAFDQDRTEFKQKVCTLRPALCGDVPVLTSIRFVNSPGTVGLGQHLQASSFLAGTNSDQSDVPPGAVSGAHWSLASSTPAGIATIDDAGDMVASATGYVQIQADITGVAPALVGVWVTDQPVAVASKLTVEGPSRIVDGAADHAIPHFTASVTDDRNAVIANPVLTWRVVPASVGSIDALGYFTPHMNPGTAAKATVRAFVVNPDGTKVSGDRPIFVSTSDDVVLDFDNDGVIDSLDQCPHDSGSAAFNGCPDPDRDHDGIPNTVDRCPDQSAPGTADGCPVDPDRDHDGIPNTVDRCPDQSAPGTADGCPVPVGPDLVVTGIHLDAPPIANNCIGFVIDVKNRGNQRSPDTKHGVLLAFDKSFAPSTRSTLPWSDNQSTGINPGETRPQATNQSPNAHGNCPGDNSKWLAQSGTFTVWAYVDDPNQSTGVDYVDELDETNNTFSYTFRIP